MNPQNFSNHVRRHPLYHFFILPLSLIQIPGAILNLIYHPGFDALILAVATLLIHLLAFIARDYAKKNQDRIIRLELRLRYWQLTSKSFEEIETELSISQLLALRFASDEEFISLLGASKVKTMSGAEIKEQIRNWVPDTMRV